MKNYKKKISLMVVLIICTVAMTACGNRFDATGYTEALLDQYLQGDVSDMLAFDDEANAADLKKDYVNNVDLFVQRTIQGDMEMSDETFSKYESLCKNIFSAMRYKVKDSKHIGSKTYEVTVEIQPSDVFKQFMEGVQEEQAKLLQKAQNGEYSGTDEEIQQQVTDEFVESSYGVLEQSCQNMTYEEKEDIVLTVTADDDNKYAITDDSFSQFFDQILQLDEINGTEDSE